MNKSRRKNVPFLNVPNLDFQCYGKSKKCLNRLAKMQEISKSVVPGEEIKYWPREKFTPVFIVSTL
jgi:hypothetical protein